ncbi:uncharacterized protein CANTADRAFT_87625 [Suhomyces tanzawaensis NRRL Y-17324]|uniref:BHLH domain-containing protein n=1 Tax=Suhomyces tanzawaensis NRRL Y-17324 TaxID=984487 RepID=A0A1E4SQ80_9ASCO|nr:uncharacterized protein CANTADRAFT_87625 [Suhomyces tanzawaensis NRRL Y-17324]ODV81655.1 hypothetical protein CANTADRAFT_87625 [Suhomyces tanzawaensis NRRL Y-17324]
MTFRIDDYNAYPSLTSKRDPQLGSSSSHNRNSNPDPIPGPPPSQGPFPQPIGYPYDYGVQYPSHTASNNSLQSSSLNYGPSSDFPTPVGTGYVQPEFMGDMCRTVSANPEFESGSSFVSPIPPGMFDMPAPFPPPHSNPIKIEPSPTQSISSSQERIVKQRIKSEPTISVSRPQQLPPKNRTRSAHNIIEQRYRNKINAKFDTLLNTVPSLRVVVRTKKKLKTDNDFESSGDDLDCAGSDDDDPNHPVDLEGLKPARKLNKGTILTKSIEYIKFLELKNQRMKLENEELIMKVRMLGLHPDTPYRR